MNTIDIQLKKIKEKQQMGLMTHAVVGYPTVSESEKIIRTLVSAGSDFLELQIPFSDPIADGETIMRACETALTNGTTTDKVFQLLEKLDGAIDIPILLMAYYNTIFRYGPGKFCERAKRLKVSGLIVPDIPPEEGKSEKFISKCLAYDIYPIRVVSPSSSIERLKINARFARGFIYCVSHFGVTGSRTDVDSKLFGYLKKVKKITKLPVAVGFGIEEGKQIEKLKHIADIAIVGSAIIKNYEQGEVNKVFTFIRSLKAATIEKYDR